jgi:hypothetical protein
MTVQTSQTQPGIWCNKHEATKILGVSQSTLKKLRLTNQLTEGVHWSRFSSRCVRYNADLLKDWAMNRANAGLHNKGIANYLSSLPSYQPQSHKTVKRSTRTRALAD